MTISMEFSETSPPFDKYPEIKTIYIEGDTLSTLGGVWTISSSGTVSAGYSTTTTTSTSSPYYYTPISAASYPAATTTFATEEKKYIMELKDGNKYEFTEKEFNTLIEALYRDTELKDAIMIAKI